jgi:hypothetical protein
MAVKQKQTAVAAAANVVARVAGVTKQDLEVAREDADRVMRSHAETTQYALAVLQVIQLAGPAMDPKAAARIRATALQMFRIEGLAAASAVDKVNNVIDQLADQLDEE